MSISSNSKLKAAFTWAGHTRPAVALMLPSHPPEFLALGEGHLQPAVAAGYGAFDLDLSGHFPNLTTIEQGGSSDLRAGPSASSTLAGKVIGSSAMIARSGTPGRHGWKQPFLQPWL